MSVKYEKLRNAAIAVLERNDIGTSTKPAPRLYPYQWLWDSCFIAIGLRWLDPERAQREILSLLKGQWQNGMVPHIVFSADVEHYAGPEMWASKKLKGSPNGMQTSCITQPPMVAEAAMKVGEALSGDERKMFYGKVFPGLVRYHEWLYRERDPGGSGLVALIHPWEAGNEDAPHWAKYMPAAAPDDVRHLHEDGRDAELDARRPDLKHAPADERPRSIDFFTFYHLLEKIRQRDYQLASVADDQSIPVIQDVLFNAILTRANRCLSDIAGEIGEAIPSGLAENMHTAAAAFDELYADGYYHSRDYRTGALITEPCAGSLAGLYAGTIPQKSADKLARLLQENKFWPRFGVASTPTDSPYFRPRGFWQGPVWMNMNWLLIEGLKGYGHSDVAVRLQEQSLRLVEGSGGMYEYFSALDGKGAGTDAFSWTAALSIDMISTLKDSA